MAASDYAMGSADLCAAEVVVFAVNEQKLVIQTTPYIAL